jgi:hypothetical protein
VEGARERAFLDGAAVTEVRAEVRAERVLQVERPAFVAPEHELAAEVVQRGHFTGREVLGIRDLEPAERDREREATTHDSPSGRE